MIANPLDVITSPRLITLGDVRCAARRIAPYVQPTLLVRSHPLSDYLGTNLYLKLEMFQRTGAFKVRGAFNKMLTLSVDNCCRGVVAVSGGNHAQAVAYAARYLGLPSLILIPEFTPANYLEATRVYGARIVLTSTMAEAFKRVKAYQHEGYVHIHPFDDPLVMAGQGTIGLEVLADLPEVSDVVVSIGGGGLMGGIATAIKGLKPEARIWGVETEGADSMAQSLAARAVVELPAITSIARTLGVPAVAKTALALGQKYLEGVTIVSDSEAIEALRFLLQRAKVLTELAASCTLAAAVKLRDRFSPEHHVVLILSGGNIAVNDICCETGVSGLEVKA